MNCWVAMNNHNAFKYESRPDGNSTKPAKRKAMSISHWRTSDQVPRSLPTQTNYSNKYWLRNANPTIKN